MTPSLHFSELSVSERRTAIRTYVLAHRKTRPTALLSLVHGSKFGNKIISAKAGDHRCRHFEYQARNDKLKAIITYTRTSASAIHPTEGELVRTFALPSPNMSRSLAAICCLLLKGNMAGSPVPSNSFMDDVVSLNIIYGMMF